MQRDKEFKHKKRRKQRPRKITTKKKKYKKHWKMKMKKQGKKKKGQNLICYTSPVRLFSFDFFFDFFFLGGTGRLKCENVEMNEMKNGNERR